jgi:hypothetical protein
LQLACRLGRALREQSVVLLKRRRALRDFGMLGAKTLVFRRESCHLDLHPRHLGIALLQLAGSLGHARREQLIVLFEFRRPLRDDRVFGPKALVFRDESRDLDSRPRQLGIALLQLACRLGRARGDQLMVLFDLRRALLDDSMVGPKTLVFRRESRDFGQRLPQLVFASVQPGSCLCHALSEQSIVVLETRCNPGDGSMLGPKTLVFRRESRDFGQRLCHLGIPLLQLAGRLGRALNE